MPAGPRAQAKWSGEGGLSTTLLPWHTGPKTLEVPAVGVEKVWKLPPGHQQDAHAVLNSFREKHLYINLGL